MEIFFPHDTFWKAPPTYTPLLKPSPQPKNPPENVCTLPYNLFSLIQVKIKNSENAILPFVNSFERSRAFEPVTNQVISNDIDRNSQVNNVEMKSIIHERNPTDKSSISMVEDQAPEHWNNLTASGCMLNLKEDKDTFVLKTNKVTTKSDADIEIVYEKLVAYGSEGNGRIV